MTDDVKRSSAWVLGPEQTPFFTMTWSPASETPKAYVLFVHGFSEHVARYDHIFTRLAASPSQIHITAFDQRGHGRTAHAPLTDETPEVKAWKKEGKSVILSKNTKRKTGGWAKVMPDIEWFLKRESEVAKRSGRPLFLWGFSMGGGQVLAFCTRPEAPPSKTTLGLLSGVIAGGPMIRQTTPASVVQVKAGSMIANLGLGDMLMKAPVGFHLLSHNKEANAKAEADPYCEPVGTLRGLSDMIGGGKSLDTTETWNRWPKDMPVLVYHGGEDAVCDPQAAKRFGEGAAATDKTFRIFHGMFHEVHNEFEPTQTELVDMISEWVLSRSSTDSAPVSSSKL